MHDHELCILHIISMTADIFLNYLLENPWHIARTVKNPDNENVVAFAGVLDFYQEGTDYIFFEKGVLTTLRTEVKSTRKYIYKKINDSLVSVFFEDGAPFYSYDLSTYPHFKINHHCTPDLYVGSIQFTPDKWMTDWLVRGPNKSHRIVTQYSLSLSYD